MTLQRKRARRWLPPGSVALFLVLPATFTIPLAAAESPFPGQTFTYSYPPLDVDTLTAARDNAVQIRSDLPILINGIPSDLSTRSFIFFSTGNDCQFTNVYPVIAVHEGGQWNTIPFPGAKNHFWSHVYRSYPDGERMYAISSYHCGEPGGIYIYHSEDAGKSWTVASIRMYYLSHFVSLRIEPDGTGEIIVQSDNDADPVGGHHVYRTSDWGESWSEPEFSSTILAPPVRPGDNLTRSMLDSVVRAAITTPSRNVPVPRLMEDISNDYARLQAPEP